MSEAITYYKVSVTANIFCLSELHVGGMEPPKEIEEKERQKNFNDNTEASEDENKKDKPKYRQCTHRGDKNEDISETDFYIPANTINGFIRRLADNFLNDDEKKTLLGAEKTSTDRQGGKLSISPAYRQKNHPKVSEKSGAAVKNNFPEGVEFENGWHPKRRTLITAHTRIDDRIGTSYHQHLYHVEQHPIGSVFQLELEAYYLSEKELETLKKLLNLWQNNEAFPIAANKSKSWGMTYLSDIRIQCSCIKGCISNDEETNTLKDYILNDTVIPVHDDKKTQPKEVCTPKELTQLYSLTLITKQPLLINDINQLNLNDKNDGAPKKHYTLNTAGQVIIPAKTLAGAFRAEARKRKATALLGSGEYSESDIDAALNEADQFIDQLFGGEQQSSCLRFRDAVLNNTGVAHLQTQVPIDRITGAACQGQGSKSVFSVEALKTGLTFTCNIYQHRDFDKEQGEEQKALLAEVVQYFSEVGIWLGGDKARGFGLLSVDVEVNGKRGATKKILTEVFAGKLDSSSETENNSKNEPEEIHHSNLKAVINPYAMVKIGDIRTSTSEARQYPTGGYPTGNIRHDINLPDCYSGVLTCRLTTMTDVFVGAEKKDQGTTQPTLYYHYTRNGQLAFPASSLRGMIGSVMETISQSRLRVVENHEYIVRKPPNKALSALGRIKYDAIDDSYSLIPLTLPHARLYGGKLSFGRDGSETSKWQRVFNGIPLSECVVIKPRNNINRHGQIIRYASPFTNQTIVSSNINNRNFYRRRGLLLGQWVNYRGNSHQATVRVMNWHGNTPVNYKHDIAIPEVFTSRNPLEIPKSIVENFNAVLTEAHERLGADGKSVARPDGYNFQLADGQIVYFDVNKDGTEVTDLSYSAIWRKFFDTKTTYQGLPNDSLPWGEPNNTNFLTPTEALLGVVEEGQKGNQRNLASRLRFTDAVLIGSKDKKLETRQKITLKILNTPKLPSPNLYFHSYQDNGKTKFKFNGRKHYLRQNNVKFEVDDGNSSYAYESLVVREANDPSEDIRIQCKPIKADQKTEFDIHFHNLNEDELKLLILSLNPEKYQASKSPKTFHHKLGLGKPLGLGSVKLNVLSVKLLDDKKVNQIIPLLKGDDLGNYVDKVALERLQHLGKPIPISQGLLNYPISSFKTKYKKDRNGNFIRNADGTKEIAKESQFTQLRDGKVTALEEELFEWHGENKYSHNLAKKTLVIKPYKKT